VKKQTRFVRLDAVQNWKELYLNNEGGMTLWGGEPSTVIHTFIQILEGELKLEDEKHLMNQMIETHKNLKFDTIIKALSNYLQELKQ